MSERKKRVYIIAGEIEAKELARRMTGLGYATAGSDIAIDTAIGSHAAHTANIIIVDTDHVRGDAAVEGVRRLRREFGIPTILMCCGESGEEMKRWLDVEPYGYISKPYTDASVIAALEIAFRRMHLEKYLVVSERKYRSIFEESKDAIYISDSHGSIIDFNTAMKDLFGYEDTDMEMVAINDLCENLDGVVRIYSQLEQYGFIKDLEVSLKKKDGEVIYGLLTTSYLSEGPQGVKFYQNILKEITPIKQRAFEEIQRSLERLHDVMYGMIDAMSLVIEARDPYTAGHQREVTRIAEAIARYMGLDENVIEGLKVAALIHDIGKLSVPAEILSKPGRLTDIEFRLVKEHPVVGYSMLKPINFPWPVAGIIRQHHERWDGSGYPDGLKGDGILLEARIIGAADVIEAMSAHRPYRPSLGLDKALEEIRTGSGIKYDPGVAEACAEVFGKQEESEFTDRRVTA